MRADNIPPYSIFKLFSTGGFPGRLAAWVAEETDRRHFTVATFTLPASNSRVHLGNEAKGIQDVRAEGR